MTPFPAFCFTYAAETISTQCSILVPGSLDLPPGCLLSFFLMVFSFNFQLYFKLFKMPPCSRLCPFHGGSADNTERWKVPTSPHSRFWTLHSTLSLAWCEMTASLPGATEYFFHDIDAPLLDRFLIILQIYVRWFQPPLKHSFIKSYSR